ncbi:putative benzoate 4-monooxygenase cytochrome P450 [Halenospora varia]|nr:putative benzoate 4-monooxygenase cytochrome P450 [Halenospora varia]
MDFNHTFPRQGPSTLINTDFHKKPLLKDAFDQVSYHPKQLILTVLGLAIFKILITSIYTRHFQLSHIPGPSWAAYTRLYLSKVLASGKSCETFVNINQKYGPLARIGPNHLLTSSPTFVRKILAARSGYTRGPWFDSIRIDPLVPNIVSERSPKRHNQLRHQMSAGYAGKDIVGLESSISERISDFVSRIEEKWVSEEGETRKFDIARRTQYLTLDIITHLCFGKPFGFVEGDGDMYGFLETIESQLPVVQHFSVWIEINTLFRKLVGVKWLRAMIMPSVHDEEGIGRIMGFVFQFIIARSFVSERTQKGAEGKKDMLNSFLTHGLSPTDAETEITISLVAGSDTTATSIRSTLLSIISNPRVYGKLRAEIDSAISRGQISPDCVTDAEARALPYLQACIKEGLRRFPSITQLRERVVPEGGDWYDGKFIPGGTFIGLNAWGVQLDPVFGEDADVYRPERWLDNDEGRLKEMARTMELVFGGGDTRCLGVPIAGMVLNKIFVELLRRFDIEVVNPMKPMESTCYGIFFQKEFFVRITKRNDR